MRNQSSRNRLHVVGIALAMGVVTLPAGLHGQDVSGAQRIKNAERLLETGRYGEARTEYAEIARTAGGNAGLRANALFGQALASQQAAALEPRDAAPLDSVLTAYRTARTLDSTRLFGPASNNAGLVLRAAGRHREALQYFLDAATTTHAARAYFYLNAGRTYEQLGIADSAARMYQRALETDGTYTEARQALLGAYARRPSADSLLALAQRWGTDPALAPAVNEAILEVLGRENQPAQPAHAESLLVVLAANFANTGVSGQRFGLAYAARLADLETKRPALAAPIRALRLACTDRKPTELYREPAEASWWHETRGRTGRRQVWSHMLRVLGDRYSLRGDTDLAASFYEAAVGYPRTTFVEPWIDLDALLPLGAIYVARLEDNRHNRDAVLRLNELTEQLFMGKGAAYRDGDPARIRSFHITLGKMYADRKQWGDRYNPRGAIFQLERMRKMTQRMRQDGDTTAFDPPQLLEKLAGAYFATKQPVEGRRTAQAAAAGYTKLRRDADATRVTQWLRAQPTTP